MYHSSGISLHTLGDLNSIVRIYTRASTHTHMHGHACSYMTQAQSRDLQYISIWQYINTVIKYRIMMLCFMSIEMVTCKSQKDCST